MVTVNARLNGSESRSLTTLLTATSLLLGVTELVAPAAIARLSGVVPTPGVRTVIRALGGREVAHGLAMLSSPRLVWTRTAGDVLDVAVLAAGHRTHSSSRQRGLAVAGLLSVVGGLDVVATRRRGAA